MAPTLLGMHHRIVCQTCGYEFPVDGAAGRVGAVCPLCGEWRNPLRDEPVYAGDRVLVDKAAWAFRSPQRWEIAVLRDPRYADQLVVKRIVGLPGETLRFEPSGISINGQVVHKPLPVLRDMALPVWTSDRKTAELPPAWDLEPGWETQAGSLVLDNAPDSPLEWGTFRNWRRQPGDPFNFQPFPPVPDSGYNQLASLPEFVVSDLYLSAAIEHESRGRFALRWNTHVPQTWEVDLATGSWQAKLGEEVVSSGTVPVPSPFRVESALSEEWRVWINGNLVETGDLGEAKFTARSASEPFSLGGSGELRISEITLAADVSPRPQTGPVSNAYNREVTLGPDEYYVLGDNLSASSDSRKWGKLGHIPRSMIYGKSVLFWSRSGETGRGIQVPALGEIGYIR